MSAVAGSIDTIDIPPSPTFRVSSVTLREILLTLEGSAAVVVVVVADAEATAEVADDAVDTEDVAEADVADEAFAVVV